MFDLASQNRNLSEQWYREGAGRTVSRAFGSERTSVRMLDAKVCRAPASGQLPNPSQKSMIPETLNTIVVVEDTAGSLQFSTDLLNLDRDVGDYVIVHELLHFSVPNHGKLWKSLMRAHLGDYERLENRLKRFAALSNGRISGGERPTI
jgi:hypothetical protein